ncbi:MAG: hypothetical protein JWP95_333 [Actinotalea sp.]|nr:hypothetical protein [Actinotalea sp.]
MSGLPGVGKSTAAQDLGRAWPAPVLSVDPVEAALWRSGVERDQPTGLAAYVAVEAMAEGILELGLSVVVDAVNGVEEAREQWRALAGRLQVPVRFIEVVCPDTELHRSRLAARTRGIEGFPEPDWDSVEARRGTWAAWTDERLVLDASRPREINLAEALAYLGREPGPERSGRPSEEPPET